MKKTISILLIALIIFSFTSCHTDKIAIENCEWKMRTVMSNNIELTDNDALVIAVGEYDEVYPNATVVEIILTAADGKITVADITNDKIYNGTYKVTKSTPKSIDYEIEIDGQRGYATVAPTKYYNGTEIPTLPINLGEYSIYFIPNE